MKQSNGEQTSWHQLRECASLKYILLGDLRDLLEEPAGPLTSKWLLAVLDALLDTLPREFELKQQGGYLEEVLEQFPNWSGEVYRLRDEYEELCQKLQDLRDQVAMEAPFTEIAAEVDRDLREWMTHLTAHTRHEHRVLQTAFNLDVGIGD
ncbi:MAG: hypothetical protein ACREJB_03430 [Planctomycetaceae bacterium]